MRTLSAAMVLGLVAVLAGRAPAALRTVVDPPVDLGDGLYSYTVHIDSDSPNIDYWMSGWDGRFTGPMNQVWFAGMVPTPTLDVAELLGAEAARDSHFLFSTQDVTSVRYPTETLAAR